MPHATLTQRTAHVWPVPLASSRRAAPAKAPSARSARFAPRRGGIDAIRLITALAVVDFHARGSHGHLGSWRMPTMALIGCWFAAESRGNPRVLLRNFAIWAGLQALANGVIAARHQRAVLAAVFESVICSQLWYVPFALASGFIVRKAMGGSAAAGAAVATTALIAIPCPIPAGMASRWWQVVPCIGLAVLCRTSLHGRGPAMLALAMSLLAVPGASGYSIALVLLVAGRSVMLPGGATLAALSRAIFWSHPLVALVLYKFRVHGPGEALAASLATACLIVATRLRKYA
ncbi:hypothetical protein TA3x_000163 [Tundrisphaera sp. TA3]|uniref:hypothetical protein n=1 Tax=Tundrisphaera sp. TA3 TaxID=3435775 RepID=UPI003EBDFA9E